MLRPITERELRIIGTGWKIGIDASARAIVSGLRFSPSITDDAPKHTSRPPALSSDQLLRKLDPPMASITTSSGRSSRAMRRTSLRKSWLAKTHGGATAGPPDTARLEGEAAPEVVPAPPPPPPLA